MIVQSYVVSNRHKQTALEIAMDMLGTVNNRKFNNARRGFVLCVGVHAYKAGDGCFELRFTLQPFTPYRIGNQKVQLYRHSDFHKTFRKLVKHKKGK